MKPEKLPASAFLSTVLAMSSFASLGLAGAAFATVENSNMTQSSNNTSAVPPGNDTATATSNASSMAGAIASIQLDDNSNPAWVTAGHWKLESDSPLIGNASNNATDVQISNFTATLYMVSNENGTAFHAHEISNFSQTSVQHQGANSTTVNGTFTVTLEEGPVNNVQGYIHIINDKIEFWIDPVATDNHFGPTTVTGIVLDPEKTGQMSKGRMAPAQGANSTATSWQ